MRAVKLMEVQSWLFKMWRRGWLLHEKGMLRVINWREVEVSAGRGYGQGR